MRRTMSPAASASPKRSRRSTYSGWKSRCTGICNRPTTSALPLHRRSRWRTANANGTATPFATLSILVRSVSCSSILTRAAGFTESLRIAHYAELKGVSIAPHSAGHLHSHLVSAFGDAAFGAESFGNPGRHPIQDAIYRGGAEVKNGMVHLSEAPGFGLEIDWQQVEKLRA